jgi:hypothetical protein
MGARAEMAIIQSNQETGLESGEIGWEGQNDRDG